MLSAQKLVWCQEEETLDLPAEVEVQRDPEHETGSMTRREKPTTRLYTLRGLRGE